MVRDRIFSVMRGIGFIYRDCMYIGIYTTQICLVFGDVEMENWGKHNVYLFIIMIIYRLKRADK